MQLVFGSGSSILPAYWNYPGTNLDGDKTQKENTAADAAVVGEHPDDK